MDPKTKYLNSLTSSNPSATGTSPTTVAVPTYGSTITDTSGNQGVAKFNPNTGQALSDPNSEQGSALGGTTGTTSSTSSPALDAYINTLKNARGEYSDLAKPSDAEQQARLDVANLSSKYTTDSTTARQNYENTLNTPGGSLAGASQAATYENRHANADLANTADQKNAAANTLSALVGNREANTTYAQGKLDQLKPISTTAGTSLVDPTTGQPIFGGTGAYTDKQAQDTYFNLAQTYPDAQIPPYNLNKTPQENLQAAQTAAAGSPSFGAKGLVAVKDPAGGITFVDKKNVNGSLAQNPDGTYTLLSSSQGATDKATTASLGQQYKYLDTATRATNTANQNFDSLITFMQQNGINDSNVPIFNQITNKVKGGLLDPGALATYNSSIETLRSEYAQVLSKGGEVTDSVRNAANAVIPDNLTPTQLGVLRQRIQTETTNAINEAQGQINSSLQRVGGSSSGSNSSGGSEGDPLGIL